MITISSYRHNYNVCHYANTDFINEIASKDNIFTIIDRKVFNLYKKELSVLLDKPHFLVDAIEENKTLAQTLPIIDELVKLKSRKETTIVAIGGGIIQDLSCFIATILYRGIKWYLVPTTLLAQTDSCIGSKSSINLDKYKNLLGTFYPPNEIFICTSFLDTLTDKDYKSGLGEIAKCLLMDSEANFREFCTDLPKILERDYKLVEKHMIRTLSFKKSIIEQDEFDLGIRNIMNYGHTFGHALETSTNYAIPHGQAVSIGLLIANEISFKRGFISNEYKEFIFNNVKKIISKNMTGGNPVSIENTIENMKMDKKFNGSHNCILLTKDGAEKIKGISDDEIKESMSIVLKSLEI